MAGGPALLGDESEHERRVEKRGVGRCQVPGDEDVGLVAVRHPGHRHAQQTGDDTIPHVVQVRHPAGQVLTGTGQQGPVRGKGVVHCALGRASEGDPPLHVRQQLRILGHHGLCLEHGLGLAAGQIAARDQICGHGFDGLTGAPLLTLGVLGRDLLGRRLQDRRPHVPDLADRHSVAHTDASQRCLHLTRPA